MKALLLLLLPLSAFAGNELGNGRTSTGTGNELGNGGDLVAQQFIEGGRELVARLRQYPDSRIPDVDALAKAVERVKVTSAKDLTLHGAEVDAINFPSDDHIDVNRSRWVEAPAEKRASLVLHEYLGIMQVPDLHYEISGSYADAFHVAEEKPRRFSLEAGASVNSGVPSSYRWGPGVEMTLAYALSPRSSLTLQGARQSHTEDYDDGSSATGSITTVSAGYKLWLNDSRKLRPFVEGHAGYAAPHYDSTFAAGAGPYGQTTYYKYNGDDWESSGPFLGAGGGARYALSKDFGLTGSAYLQELGLFRRYARQFALQLNLGVDVLL